MQPQSKSTLSISFIVPCYNEEETIGYSIPRLVTAFQKAGHNLELIAVDNGSLDNTDNIIRQLAAAYPCVVPHRVEKNEGYGNGVLSAVGLCRAPWIGIIPADGQVDASDVVQLFEAAIATDGNVIAKVRRRFRMDGLVRKLVSCFYNGLVWTLWPRLGSIDVNGSPKIVQAKTLKAMQLESKQWFLDPEIMIKGHYMGVRVMEFNVFARMRGNGLSHVKPEACLEFIRKLLWYRFSPEMYGWRQRRARLPVDIRKPQIPTLRVKPEQQAN